MPFDPDSPEAKLGDAGEEVAREWLRRQGYYVLPTSLLPADGAPMIHGLNGAIILPDDLVCKDGITRWVDTKTKSNATKHIITGRWEHGFPLHQWNAYLQIQEHSGIEGWLAVIELSTSSMLLGRLDNLAATAREYYGDKMPGGRPHIFLERALFEQYSLRDMELPEPLPPNSERTLKQHLPPCPGRNPLVSGVQGTLWVFALLFFAAAWLIAFGLADLIAWAFQL